MGREEKEREEKEREEEGALEAQVKHRGQCFVELGRKEGMLKSLLRSSPDGSCVLLDATLVKVCALSRSL